MTWVEKISSGGNMISKKSFMAVLWVVALAMLVVPATAVAADNAISFGFGGAGSPDASAAVGYLEYERAIGESVGLALRAGTISYEYDDDVYWEEGDGPGMEASFRFYTSGEALSGFYIGGGLGVWFTEWDWRDDYGTIWETRGSGDSASVELHFALGGRIGDTVQFNPSFQLGHFVSSESEMGLYFLVGAALGIPF
jgi:hypothetical protein